ncbi:hypothetical protein EDB19DRAFT_172729 [Suillus lakei]|nr:hypothetical protein EDB19DRAFT_172729 [Suillus lakei]
MRMVEGQEVGVWNPLCRLFQILARKSLSTAIGDAERVWCICRAFPNYLRSRNPQGVPPPSRAIVSGQAWLGKKCQYQIFQFLTEYIKPKSTWILLKPHVDSPVANFVFPKLTFNASKQAMWEADPIGYIRASAGAFIWSIFSYHSFPYLACMSNEDENFSSPVSGAISFLLQATAQIRPSFQYSSSSTVLRS